MRVPSRVSFGTIDNWGSFGQVTPAPAVDPVLAPLMVGATPLADIGSVRENRRRFIVKGSELASLGPSGAYPGESETTLVLYLYGAKAGQAELVLTAQVATEGWSIVDTSLESAAYSVPIVLPSIPPIPIDDLSKTTDLIDKAIADTNTAIKAGDYATALKVINGAKAQAGAGQYTTNILEDMGLITSDGAQSFIMLFLGYMDQADKLYNEIQNRGTLIDQFASGLVDFVASTTVKIDSIFNKDVDAAKRIVLNFLALRQATYDSIKAIAGLSPEQQNTPQVQDELKLCNDRLAQYNAVVAATERIAGAHGLTLKALFGADTQLSALGIGPGGLAIIGIILQIALLVVFALPSIMAPSLKQQRELNRQAEIDRLYVQTIQASSARGEADAVALKKGADMLKLMGAFAPEDVEKFGPKALPKIKEAIEKGKEVEQDAFKKALEAAGEGGTPWSLIIGAALIIGLIIYMKTRKQVDLPVSKRR